MRLGCVPSSVNAGWKSHATGSRSGSSIDESISPSSSSQIVHRGGGSVTTPAAASAPVDAATDASLASGTSPVLPALPLVGLGDGAASAAGGGGGGGVGSTLVLVFLGFELPKNLKAPKRPPPSTFSSTAACFLAGDAVPSPLPCDATFAAWASVAAVAACIASSMSSLWYSWR